MIEISNAELEVIVAALRYYAHSEAGQTQEPNLCVNEDYEEWHLAERLEKSLARSKAARARRVLPTSPDKSR